MFAHMYICLRGTMMHRVPHRYDVHRLGKGIGQKGLEKEKERDSANVYAASRVHGDPLEIGGGHNGACYVIRSDYFVILFASSATYSFVALDPALEKKKKKFNSKPNIFHRALLAER